MEGFDNSLNYNSNGRIAYTESDSSREGTFSNITNSQLCDGQWDPKHGKKFELSRHREIFTSQPYYTNIVEALREDASVNAWDEKPQQPIRETQSNVPQQPAAPVAYPYSYNATNQAYINDSKRARLVVSPDHSYAPRNPVDASIRYAASDLPIASGKEVGLNSTTGYVFTGLPTESNVYNRQGSSNYCQYGLSGQETGIRIAPKEVITLTNCVLYPPDPRMSPPPLKPKPKGCKTIFIGGLPEKVTKEIIKEAFERFGTILDIRLNKMKFCHVRFAEESQAEYAISLSGYRMKIENRDEAVYSRQFRVDFSDANEDRYEYECNQRKAQREHRHKERAQEPFRASPPPSVIIYTEKKAMHLGEKLRDEETFQEAVLTLVSWFERGICNKHSAEFFYSMVHRTSSHIRRLTSEKAKYEEEVHKARMKLKEQIQKILIYFNEINKVFAAACLKKNWDHFTKAQRKNIDTWKKEMEEIRNAHVEEALNERVEDEMELCDDSPTKVQEENNDKDQAHLLQELKKCKEECEALRCQLQASENTARNLRAESKAKNESEEQQLLYLREALQGFYKEIVSLNEKQAKADAEIKELNAFKAKHGECKENSSEKDLSSCDPQGEASSIAEVSSSSNTLNSTEDEAPPNRCRSNFLNGHPLRAKICSFMRHNDSGDPPEIWLPIP